MKVSETVRSVRVSVIPEGRGHADTADSLS